MRDVGIFAAILGVGLCMLAITAIVFAAPVWFLWNWVAPSLFGAPEISIFQALGLVMLTGLLFRGGGLEVTRGNQGR